MQKAIMPATLLSVAFQKEEGAPKKEFEFKAIKNNAHATASHLYRLFFGIRQLTVDIKASKERRAAEPDDYSSYE